MGFLTARVPRITDVLRTRFGLTSAYFHSLLCEMEDRIGRPGVFEVHDPLLEELQHEIETSAYHPHYSAEYRRVESSYWGPVLQVLRNRAASGLVGKSCLDIGGGYGTLLLYASRLGWQPHEIDISTNFLSPELVKKYGVRFHVANIEAGVVPWRERFDLILVTEVLEHFNFNPLPTLRKVYDCLAPEGLLVLTTPNKHCGWGEAVFQGPYWELPAFDSAKRIVDTHVKVYDRFELADLLDAVRFRGVVAECRRKGWRRGHLVALAGKEAFAPGWPQQPSGVVLNFGGGSR